MDGGDAIWSMKRGLQMWAFAYRDGIKNLRHQKLFFELRSLKVVVGSSWVWRAPIVRMMKLKFQDRLFRSLQSKRRIESSFALPWFQNVLTLSPQKIKLSSRKLYVALRHKFHIVKRHIAI